MNSSGIICLTLALLCSAVSDASGDATPLNAPPLQPVWQFELAPPPKGQDLSLEMVPFPEPEITRNDFLGADRIQDFPLRTVTLRRNFVMPSGFEGYDVMSLVIFNPDGTPADPPSLPFKNSSFGISISDFPCVDTSAASSPNGQFQVLKTNSSRFLAAEASRRYDGVHCLSNVGLAVGSTMQATEIFSFATQKSLQFPGHSTLNSSNVEAGAAAFIVTQSVGPTTHEIVVVNRSGDLVARRALPNHPSAMTLTERAVILSLGSSPYNHDVVWAFPEGELKDIPELPGGLRIFSGDGTHLLILGNNVIPNVLYYYDMRDPFAPAHLWTRTLENENPTVTSKAVSDGGRLVAYQVSNKATRNSDLLVISREGVELGGVRHRESYPVDGVVFVDDRFLLEGVYSDGFVYDTRTGRLYDLAKTSQ